MSLARDLVLDCTIKFHQLLYLKLEGVVFCAGGLLLFEVESAEERMAVVLQLIDALDHEQVQLELGPGGVKEARR